MWIKDRKFFQLLSCLMLCASFTFPTGVQAQSSNDALMRMVCFDSDNSTGLRNNEGWTVVVTQMNNEKYKADIFIPDGNGDFADKFPMFENTYFFIAVFPNAPAANTLGNIQLFAEELLNREDAPTAILAEGSRVGTLLDLNLDGSGAFQYDSLNQANNLFVDPITGEERNPVCERPFYHTP